jgi:hypothetical protein
MVHVNVCRVWACACLALECLCSVRRRVAWRVAACVCGTTRTRLPWGPRESRRYAQSLGWTFPICQAACPAGYFCPAGSVAPTTNECSRGQYSLAGAGNCTLCPAGRFGASVRLTSANCTGPCAAGFWCPAGSTGEAPMACALGRYSTGGEGDTACTLCPPGKYGGATMLPSEVCSGDCPSGRFGSVAGNTLPTCSGVCPAGYACPAGSVSATAVLCSAGQYSLTGFAACMPCRAVSRRRCLAAPRGFHPASSARSCAPAPFTPRPAQSVPLQQTVRPHAAAFVALLYATMGRPCDTGARGY